MKNRILPLSTIALALFALSGCDERQPEDPATPQVQEEPEPQPAAGEASDEEHRVRGTVTAIDRDTGELTVDHEPVESLNWPAMIMPFPASDPALLEGLEVGDRVAFVVREGEQGEYVIQELEQEEIR